MKNENKYYLYGALNSMVVLITTGSILQTFFLDVGFNNIQIASYNTLLSIVQIFVMGFSLFLADRIKGLKKTIAFLVLSPILLSIAMLPFCFSKSVEIRTVYRIVMVCCCVQNLLAGFNSVLLYRLPYIVFDMKDYTKITNNNAIISNVFAISLSGLINYFAMKFIFRRVMGVAFSASIVFCVLSAYSIYSMKEQKPRDTERASSDSSGISVAKLKQKEFRFFYAPNFLRGIVTGGMNSIVLFCAKEITTDTSVNSSLSTILLISGVFAGMLYQAVSKRAKTATVYFGSSTAMALFLPLTLIGRNTTIFCGAYALACIGYQIVNTSGAVYAVEIMNYHDIGTYTAVRLITMTLGQALSSYGLVWAMEYVPTVVILLVCGVCQLVSGIQCYHYEMKYRYSG